MEQENAAGAVEEHRKYVGAGEEYDLRGSAQFSLLCSLGLRDHHRLLDIGCGSLRGGRLFIAYLGAGGYTGLEPNRWLVEDGITRELGRGVVELKDVRFVHNEDFDVSGLDPFDFVLAQSIASHTGPAMTRDLMAAIRSALAPSGMAAVTFIHADVDGTEEGWHYPGICRYRRQTITSWFAQAGLDAVPLHWFHPRQTWWVAVHKGAPLPPRQWRMLARGAMLSYPRSWNAAARSPKVGRLFKLARRVTGRGRRRPAQ